MPAPLPVIIDTDPGVDDALALVVASLSPELDVLAITTVAGNVDLTSATENAQRVAAVAWAGRPPPKIYRGGSAASETALHVHGDDGLGGVATLLDREGRSLYPPSAEVSAGDAVDAIAAMAAERPGEVTLVTLGPLTNAASLFRRYPESARRLRELVVMGGAFREPGNVTSTAEFNIYVDPDAAQCVCDSGAAIRWVPVDVTHRCLLYGEDLDRLPETPLVRFVRQIVPWCFRFHETYHGEWAMYLHDPAAVGAVIWPELLQTTPLRVDVETAGRVTLGMTIADFRPIGYHATHVPNAAVCLDVDASELVRRILDRLSSTPNA